jgi:hypothetical protein
VGLRNCITCAHYVMNSGEEAGRTSLDFCAKKQKDLPASAFCFEDLCCSTGCGWNMRAFSVLEEIGSACTDYEPKGG